MTDDDLSRLFKELVTATVLANAWTRLDFAFETAVGGLSCVARLRAGAFAREDSGRLVGEVDIWLRNAEGAPEFEAFAGLRFGVALGDFPELLPLHLATRGAVEAQLMARPDFMALVERSAFDASLARMETATRVEAPAPLIDASRPSSRALASVGEGRSGGNPLHGPTRPARSPQCPLDFC